MVEVEGDEEHQEEAVEEVGLSCLPSALESSISRCSSQCFLLGLVGRFSETANGVQADLATVEVEAVDVEVVCEAVVHQEVVERQGEVVVVELGEAQRP